MRTSLQSLFAPCRLFGVSTVQVLTPADDLHHIDKRKFNVPFVCGCRNLGEALRRISEGAAMIRTKVQLTALRAVA